MNLLIVFSGFSVCSVFPSCVPVLAFLSFAHVHTYSVSGSLGLPCSLSLPQPINSFPVPPAPHPLVSLYFSPAFQFSFVGSFVLLCSALCFSVCAAFFFQFCFNLPALFVSAPALNKEVFLQPCSACSLLHLVPPALLHQTNTS